jgi:hypothetical protein
MQPSTPGWQSLILLFLLASATSLVWAGGDIKPEEVVAKHLEAIGTLEARKNIKSRVVQGPATYRIFSGGSGAIDGKCVIASEGVKTNYLFKLNASGYHGEQLISDGNRASVAGTYSDKTRSDFGDFVFAQNVMLREPLLGGVLTTGWPLLDLEGHKAQVHSEGIKRVDGQELIALRYRPKKGTDLDITLYFDPQTYRHVLTVYRASQQTGIGTDEISTARKVPTRYEIEERFSDFKVVDGLTMPSHYDLRFTLEKENGFTKATEWEVKTVNIMNNLSIDPRSFEVK